jgi:hypothetical protein
MFPFFSEKFHFYFHIFVPYFCEKIENFTLHFHLELEEALRPGLSRSTGWRSRHARRRRPPPTPVAWGDESPQPPSTVRPLISGGLRRGRGRAVGGLVVAAAALGLLPSCQSGSDTEYNKVLHIYLMYYISGSIQFIIYLLLCLYERLLDLQLL